jgi:hypothetical protein
VDRHPSILTKFAAANGQHAGSQADIFELEVARFTQAQAVSVILLHGSPT